MKLIWVIICEGCSPPPLTSLFSAACFMKSSFTLFVFQLLLLQLFNFKIDLKKILSKFPAKSTLL